MKELNDLNNIYQSMYAEDENKGYVVTAADKKGNTPAWQGYKAGKKKKDGKPMYRPADHLKDEVEYESMQHRRNPEGSVKDRFKSRQTDPSKDNFTGIGDSIEDIMKQNAAMKKAAAKKTKKEDYETKKKGEVLGAMKKQGRKLSDKDKNKIADKVVKDKGDTSKSDDRYAYEEVSPEIKKLIESGKFSDEEIKEILWSEGYQRNPEEGERKERAAAKKGEAIRGQARRKMPPRGNKDREDFERWYAANVR